MKLVISAAVVSALSLGTTPASADISHQWALRFLKVEQIWQHSKGVGVTVAVIDSGVKPNADLSANLLPGADFSNGTGKVSGNGHTDIDADGHGTGMATVISGSGLANNGTGTQGLAPEAKILPARASTSNGAGLVFSMAPAIGYAVSHGAHVINLSVGNTADDPAIRDAIQSALIHDVVVVASVGNSGNSAQFYPAAYPGVLGVGAIDETGTVWSQSNSGPDVSLVAPGVHIYRDDNQGRQGYSDGTSEATAYVSAAAALVRSEHPTWTASQVVSVLTGTADKPAALHGAARDDHYGYGILNVLAALKASAPPMSATPPASAEDNTPATGKVTSSPQDQAQPSQPAPSSSSNPWAAILVAGAALVLAAVVLLGFTLRRAGRHDH